MEKEIFIARQPILNAENELFAYELLYRDLDLDDEHPITDNRAATASVLLHTLNQFGLQELLGRFPAFIKVDAAFLMRDIICTIPKEHFVLALFDTLLPTQALIERIAHFHAQGYRFAINDTALEPERINGLESLFPYLSYCKVDTSRFDLDAAEHLELLRRLEALDIALIATKIETHAMQQRSRESGFAYFQGYYFSRPKLLTGTIHDAEQATVMKLWRLILADAPLQALAEAFEETPALSAQLLRYVNSAAFHFTTPIRSIQQILSLLGRMPLMQWLLLSISAKHAKTPAQQEPLQGLLLNRVALMTGLFELIPRKGDLEKAEVYFVALLSFIDILLGVPLRSVLDALDLDPRIPDALSAEKGLLGDLLGAARAIEQFDMPTLEAFLDAYGIDTDDVITLTMKSIEQVNAFDTLC